MGELLRFDTEAAAGWPLASAGRRPVGLSGRDWRFLAAVVGASVLSSVVVTYFIVGPLAEAMIPAVVIPLVVSVPATLYLVRQRARIELLNAQLEELLRRDQLTGVLSRRYFLRAAGGEVAGGGALMMIDIDAFKAVNDTWGHAAGDRVLAEVAGRIAVAAGPIARIGRLGGEEFAAFAPGLGEAAARSLAETLRREVAERPVMFEGQPIRCTISLGIAVVPEGQGGFDAGLRAADAALYAAKRAGRDQVCQAAPRELRG